MIPRLIPILKILENIYIHQEEAHLLIGHLVTLQHKMEVNFQLMQTINLLSMMTSPLEV